MIGPTDLLHPSPAPHFKIFRYIKKKNVLHDFSLLADTLTTFEILGEELNK